MRQRSLFGDAIEEPEAPPKPSKHERRQWPTCTHCLREVRTGRDVHLGCERAHQKRDAEPGGYKQIMDHWFQVHTSATGHEPVITGRERGAVKRLALDVPVNRACQIIDFAYSDPSTRGWATITKISADPNRFAPRNGIKQARAPMRPLAQVKPLALPDEDDPWDLRGTRDATG